MLHLANHITVIITIFCHDSSLGKSQTRIPRCMDCLRSNSGLAVSFDSPSTQRQKLINILDNLKATGINAIIFQIRPEWILTLGSLKLLDPGLPMVREYVTNVVLDVVHNYDIDGVHFDDYFYPYPPDEIQNEDNDTYANYNPAGLGLGDWRRNNVNTLLEMIYDSIKIIKSHVKFGVSPFGIWKNGVPDGIIGLDAYSQIYCDAVSWLSSKIVDYLTPQLYWPFGDDQDYGKLLPWWAEQANNRHIYAGHAVYKASGWQPNEIPNQIRLNRNTENVYGSIFFRTNILLSNPQGLRDSLKNDIYDTPALKPTMSWLDSIPPQSPENLFATSQSGGIQLNWKKPNLATDGDSVKQYVIYKFNDQEDIDLSNPRRIAAILTEEYLQFLDKNVSESQSYTYICTSLDRLHNESLPSNEANIIYTSLIASNEYIPHSFALDQSFPNPFNPETTIRFSIPDNGHAILNIFDIRGQLIEKLVDDLLPAGIHEIRFNGQNYSSGTYIYVLTTQNGTLSNKMILLK